MNNTPLFSVLIANYNNGKYILDAIDSIYQQTYKNWEIVIVDDCSSDNSPIIYDQLKDDSRIRISYNEENKGCGYTKGRCVLEARGEIGGFLDPDDKLTDDALQEMVQSHLLNPDASLVHSTFYFCDEQLNVQSIKSEIQDIEPNNPFFFNLGYDICHFSTFKIKDYKFTEGIDPYLKRAVDQDLYLKLYDVGPVVFVNKPLYFYRIHNFGISTIYNVDKANFWHWVVNISAARRRSINIEDLFVDKLKRVDVVSYESYLLNNKYLRLKKYERLNSILSRINRFIKGKKK